jgi:uroporphyrinogen-III decarboxylase
MRSRERFLAALRGEKVDRVPIHLLGFNFSNREQIASLKDPARREIAERVFDQTVFIHSVPSYINRYLVIPPRRIRAVERREEKDGVKVISEIDTPKGKLRAVTSQNRISGNTTWTVKYPVESMEDIERIRSIPWELPERLEPLDPEELPPDPDGRRVIYTRISSPFVCVAGMMRYERFLELCATELNLIRELTEECKRRIMDVLDVLLSKPGIDVVWMGGSEWVTPPMGSPRLYEELVQEQEREIIERVHRAGALAHIHCHGNVRSVIELVVDRGVDYFEPVEPPPDGDITFAEAKEIVGSRMTLGGNIEVRILEYADEDTVEKAVRAAFEGARDRMVLQTTEGVLSPLMSERALANYHRLIDVWEELSPL